MNLHTSSKMRTAAHGNPACIGSAFAATSPTCLNLSSQKMTLSASSRSLTVRPLSVNVQPFFSQSSLFSLQAACTVESTDDISSSDEANASTTLLSSSLSCSNTLLRICRLVVSAGKGLVDGGCVVGGCVVGNRTTGFEDNWSGAGDAEVLGTAI